MIQNYRCYFLNRFLNANNNRNLSAPVSKPSHCQIGSRALRISRFIGILLVAFSCSHVFAASIATDARVSLDQNSAKAKVTSPTFSTNSPNELLLAFVASDSVGSVNTTVKSIAGAGLNWVLVKRTNNQAGTSEIWRAFAPTVLSNVSVTATLSSTVASSITVATYAGVATGGTSGSGAIGAVASGYASSGAPSAKLVTTQANSLVVGVGNDFDNAIARGVLAGQSLIHQDLSSTGDTYWVQQLSAPASVKGTTITLGDSAPASDRYNLSICEILPATSGPNLTLSGSSLSFGSIVDGGSASLTVTLTSTGTSALQISSASVAGTGFSLVAGTWPQTLASGQSLNLQVNFAPTVAAAESGTLTISSNSSSGATSVVTLAGTGTAAPTPQLTLSAASLAFGSVQDASTKSMPVTLMSTGTSAVTVSSAAVSGTGFSVFNCSFPQTLAAGASYTFQVQFAPTTVAANSGTLMISSNSAAGSTAMVALTGSGTAAANPQLTVSTSALSFGTVNAGSTSTQVITLSSTGASALTVSGASVSGSGFSLTSGTLPLTLAPGATTTLGVAFAPTASGADSGTLLISSNSTTGGTTSVALSGTGAITTHSVNLTWNAPTDLSVPVAGYHIYRADPSSGSYALLNASITSATSYVDSTVASASSYVYEVKSVNASGVESAASNTFTATIP